MSGFDNAGALQRLRNLAFAGTGATAAIFLARSLASRSETGTHALFEGSIAQSRCPLLVRIASELSETMPPSSFEFVAGRLNALANEDARERGASQWIISRLSRETLDEVRRVVVRGGDAVSEKRERGGGACDWLTTRLYARDELIPQLETCLENLLFDHILRVGQ